MTRKPILVPSRLRRPPTTGWSWVDQARDELMARDLIAHETRWTQVLSLPPCGQHRRHEPGQGLMALGDVLRLAVASTHPNREGALP
jgi:hypothetical protein